MTVVVSGGKLVPVGDAKSWPLAGLERRRQLTGGKSLDLLSDRLNVSYTTIYKSQPWIFSLTNKIARGMARLPLKTYVRGDEDTRERARKHPLPILLDRPYPRGSKSKLIEATFGSMCVYGHALWWKYRPRPGMTPVELWPLDWRYVTMHGPSETLPVAYFEYRGPTGGRKVFLPDDVVHFEWWSPDAAGTSPLEPLRTTLQLEDAATRYSTASFSNGIRPAGALVTPGRLKPNEKTELRAELEGLYANPDQAFRMMLLDGGLDWKAFSGTAVEAEVINLRKLNREEVCAVFDVPPPAVQLLDRATFSNITEQRKMLYSDTFGPWLANLEDTVMAQLVWGEPELAFGTLPKAGGQGDTYIEFDLGEMLKPEPGPRSAAYSAFRAAGVYTANELRALDNLPRIEHPLADAILIPLNMLPVGEGLEELMPAGAELAALRQLALSATSVTLPE